MKKVGWFLLCFVPMIAMLAINIAATIAVEFIWIFRFIFAKGADAMAEFPEFANSLASDHDFLMTTMIIYQIIAFILAAIVYYFVFKEKKIENPIKCIGIKGLPLIIVTFFGCEVFTGCLLFVASVIPGVSKLMEGYAEMIESSGMGDLTVLSTIVTVIMAPLAEELIFRGMTFKLARKFTKSFWIANVIQAFIFGLAHLNLVQGTYAFLLGIVLGLIYQRYNSLFASMLGHLVFNFTGTYLVEPLFGGDDVEVSALRIVILTVVSIACIAVGLLLIIKDKKSAERVALFNERCERERMPKAKKVAMVNAVNIENVATCSEEPAIKETPTEK